MVDIDGLTSAALLAAFGEAIAYRPAGQPELTPCRLGIFDRAQIAVLLGDQQVPTSLPKVMLGVRQADFPPKFVFRQEDRVLVRGVTYDVVNAEPDGQGWVFLELGKIG